MDLKLNVTFKKRPGLTYLHINKTITQIMLNCFAHFLQLFLVIHLFRLSFVLNAKRISTIDDSLELAFQYYKNIPLFYCSTYITNIACLNIQHFFRKNTNLVKFVKIFYKKPGNPYLRLRKIFPAVNVAS